MQSMSLLSIVPAIFLVLLVAAFSTEASAQTGFTGIFGGGPFYKGDVAPNITEIENSGFTEAIVWSVEVSSTGDLNFNGEFPLTSGGVYVGNATYPNFPGDMAQLKQGTVKRVTFSIGSSNYGDWEDITSLVKAQGTGPTSILYQDYAALKAAIPALDAIDFDDENSFNSPTTVQFGVMLGQLGYHVMPDAFDDSSYANPDSASQSIGRDVLRNYGAIVIVPREPLRPGGYAVEIIAGDERYTWSFTVKRP